MNERSQRTEGDSLRVNEEKEGELGEEKANPDTFLFVEKAATCRWASQILSSGAERFLLSTHPAEWTST